MCASMRMHSVVRTNATRLLLWEIVLGYLIKNKDKIDKISEVVA